MCVVDWYSADMVVLTEAWLHTDIKDGELFGFTSAFSIYRCDRIDQRVAGS